MEEEKSKSQIKRELKVQQDLSAHLAALSDSQLQKIPLDNDVYAAIQQLKQIKSHTAKKRHLKFIGRLLRDAENIEAIQKAYEKICTGNVAALRLAENWRTRLLSDDKDALTEFIQSFPQAEIQQLRLLIRKACNEQEQQKNHGASNTLFRFIMDVMA